MATILYFEDEESVAELAKRKLEKAGHIVKIHLEGSNALELVKKTRPTLILLDVMLPGVDGFRILQELKNDAATQAIPVIMLTAMGEKADVIKGIELGAADYLLKPFLPKIMVERVSQVLQGHSLNLGSA